MKKSILFIVVALVVACSCQSTSVNTDDGTIEGNENQGSENKDEENIQVGNIEIDETAEFPIDGDYKLQGVIGKSYAFFMVLNETDMEANKIGGEYAYKKGSGSLKLDGYINPEGMIILDEYDKSAESTGHFVGQISGDDTLKGMWYSANGDKQLPFEVLLVNKKEKKLSGLIPSDLYKEAQKKIAKIKDNKIEGSYVWNSTYMDEEMSSGQLGIISNQGILVVESVSKTEIKYHLEAVCGPTYHLAYAGGTGIIQGDSIVCKSGEEYDMECTLVFRKKGFDIEVDQISSSTDCGFGARAYAGGTYMKVLPTVKWQEKDGELFISNLTEEIKKFIN